MHIYCLEKPCIKYNKYLAVEPPDMSLVCWQREKPGPAEWILDWILDANTPVTLSSQVRFIVEPFKNSKRL